MFITYNGYSGTILWTVLKGTTTDAENFDRAKTFAFAVSCTNVIPLNIVSQSLGVLEIEIPQGLTPDVYAVKVLWWKNDLDSHIPHLHFDKRHGWNVPDIHGGSRGVCMAYVDKLFAMTDIESEATHRGKPVIKVKSHVANYGYDGLSAYEIAVITGKTMLSQEAWVSNLSDMNEMLDEKLENMEAIINESLAEFKKQHGGQHVYLSHEEYEELVKTNMIDENAMYGIKEGDVVKMIYFGRLPFVTTDSDVVKTTTGEWTLTANIGSTTCENGGGEILLTASAERTVITYYRDGSISSKVEYGKVEWTPSVGTIYDNNDNEKYISIGAYDGEVQDRTITVTASVGTGSSKKTASFTITQKKKVVKSITWESASQSVAQNTPSKSGSYKVYYTTKNVTGTVGVSVTTGTFVTNAYAGSDEKGTYVGYDVSENADTGSRLAYLKLTIGDTSAMLAINQKGKEYKCYYGSSESEVTSVSTANAKTLEGSTVEVAISTTSEDKKKCHWIAVPTNSGYTLASVYDDTDNVTNQWSSKTLGEYTVYYKLKDYYIVNVSNITLRKN